MSTKTVEERILEMRFDNEQFERGISKTMSSVKKFKQELNMDGAAKGFDALDRAVDAVRLRFSALEVMGVTALANITNSAVNAGKRVLKALTLDPVKSGFEEYETQINAVQTILANTSSKGTTLEQVNAALDELNRYADMTIYNFTEMTRNIGTFTAAGVDLETSVGAIKGIANLAAVSGSTSQQASTAMYQLSQALAAGTVKLQDWNSVVNAGMGGQVFQEALKDTARVHGIAIDQMIADQGSFRETLQKGWLSSDILTETLQKFTGDLTKAQLLEMGYTEAQTAAILEMGKTASDAATKVKTFSQLIDTTKEAVQSGWTESWETIVGDFEEAKGLWTRISDVLSNMINSSSNARNELLSGGLDSGWSKFLNEGIADAVAFKESILEVALAHGVSVKDLASNTDSFEDSLKQGWLTADILAESLESLTQKTKSLSSEELKSLGLNAEQVETLDRLNQSVKDGTVSIEDYAKQIGRLSGRENLIAAFWNTWDALFAVPENAGELLGVVTAVKDAYRDIFPTATSEQLYQFTEKLRNLTEKFKMSEETAENVKNTFKGFFAVLDIGKQGLSVMARVVSPLFGGLGKLSGGVLGVTGNFGEWLVGLDQMIQKGSAFDAAVERTSGYIAAASNAVGNFIAGIREKFPVPGFELFHSLLERIHARMSQMGDPAGGMESGFVSTLKTMGSALENSNFFKLLNSFWELTKAIAGGATKALGDLAGGLSEKLGNINFSGVFDLLSGLSLSGIAFSVSKFLTSVSEPLEGFTNILDGVRGSLEAFQTQLKAGTLIKIASAMALLTASIVALSLVDSDKLSISIGAMAVMFAELIGAMAIMNKIGGSVKEKTQAYTSMIAMSVAISILAGAVKKLSSLDLGGLAMGLAGVGGLLAEVDVFLNTAKFSGKSVGTAAGILVLSEAIKVLASTCEDFSRMDLSQIGKGLVGIGGLLAELSLFTNLAGNAKHSVASGLAMIEIAAAMKIFASAVNAFGGMDLGRLSVGMVAIGAALAEIAISANLMPQNIAGIGVGLIAFGGALEIIAHVLGKLGGLSWGQVAVGLTAMGGALAEMAIGLNFMKGTLGGAAAMIAAAGAIVILSPALGMLGAMSWEAIAKGLISIAGGFAVIGIAGAVLTPLVPSILGLAGSFALIGAGVLGVGAGLLAAGTGLSALAVGLTAFAAAGTAGATAIVAALSVIVVGVAGMIPAVIGKIGEGVVALCEVISSVAPAIAEAFLTLITVGLSSLATYTPQISNSLLKILIGVLNSLADNMPDLIQAGVNVFASLFRGVADALGGMDVNTLILGAAGIGLLSGMMVALGAVAGLIPGAMAGAAGLGLVIAELSVIFAAIGAFAQIPGLNWLVGEGGKLLENIGVAIGSFFGGIAGGFMGGVSSQFPKIGSDLSGFMTNARPFIEGASKIDASMMDGVKALAEAILILTGADVLSGIASWLTGGSSLGDFAGQLVPFGKAMAEYSQAVSGKVNPEVVTASANAARTLSELARSLPNNGGLVSWITGDNNISSFGKNLAEFGNQLSAYYENISGIDSRKLSGVTETLQSIAGIAQDTQTLDTWGLRNFGASLAALGDMGVDGFISAFDGAEVSVKEAGRLLASNLETGVRLVIPNFQKAGQDAAQGLINGLRGKMSAVSNAGMDMGRTVVSATRKALDSHSPSEEEYEAGQDAGEGLRLGIQDSGKGVADTAASVASGAVEATKSALSGLVPDKWLGKTTQAVTDAGKAETKVAQETASAAQKSSKAKTQAAKSAYEAFLDYIEEERYYNRLTTEEELEQYKKVRDTYALSAEERKKVNREVYRLEQELRDAAYQHSMDWIEQEKYYQRLSLEEELAAYERVQARHKQGTEEWKKLEREKYRVQNELAEAAYEHSMNWIEQEEAYDRLGTAAKLAAYTRVQQRYEKGSDKRKKLDREVYNLQKQLWQAQKDYYADVEKAQSDYHEKRLSLEQEYADKVKSVNEQLEKDIQDLNDAYASALDSRADSLYKAYGLFDAVSEREEVSGEELMDNLMDQVHEFESWRDTLDALSARGLDPGLVEELQEMGPSAIAQLKALNAMSDSELDKYASLWGIKHALARRQATEELEGLRVETNSKIAGLRQDAAAELDEYRSVWQQQMSELESITAQQLEDLKTTFEKTVGILPEYTEAEFSEMVETANSILGQAGWTELGEQIVAGLSNGIEAQKAGFVQGLTDLANAGVDAVKTTLDIHSPSGVFDKLGNFTGMGFVNALSNYAGKAYEIGRNIAESARDGLSFAANAMADVLERDPEPVIRPVLDLSNLDTGARQLDTLFSREYALQIQNAGYSRSRMDEIGSLTNTLRDGLSSGDDRIVGAIQELRGDMAALADQVGRMQMVLDTGALVGEISPAIDQELGTRANWKGRNM